MSQINTATTKRSGQSILWVAIVFFLVILFVLTFYLTIRRDIFYIKGEEETRLLFQAVQEEMNEAGFFWVDDQEHLEYYYRLSLSGREAPAAGCLVGVVPVLVATNFWNPLDELTMEELFAILRGEVSTWEPLNGNQLPIEVLISPSCRGFAQGFVTALGQSVTYPSSRQETLTILAERRGALALLPWTSVDPSIKVLSLKTEGRSVNPFWSTKPHAEYPLCAEVRLVPSTPHSFKQALAQKIHQPRVEQKIAQFFRPRMEAGQWLVGTEISTLAAAGDILFDRQVAITAKEKKDFKYPLRATAEVFLQADLAFANLECPLSSRGEQLNMFRGHPAAVEALTYAGFDVISLANNHIFDYGLEALLDTITCLQKNGIVHVGVGENIYKAREPKIFLVNGIKVAFLAYTQIGLGFTYTRLPQHWAATTELPGVAEAKEGYVRTDVARAKSQADLVIVSFHWGREYEHYPTAFQRALGRTALTAGADLVIGHHPHVLQGIEFAAEGIIAYSLGNFVFDQTTINRRQSLILKAAFDQKGLRQLCLTPVFITEEQPKIAKGGTGQEILELMARLSRQNCQERTGKKE